MSEEMKAFIKETVSNMKKMDKESLLIMKSNSEVLRARDAMDREATTGRKAGQMPAIKVQESGEERARKQ